MRALTSARLARTGLLTEITNGVKRHHRIQTRFSLRRSGLSRASFGEPVRSNVCVKDRGGKEQIAYGARQTPPTHAHTHSFTTSTSNGNTAFSKNDFKAQDCVWFLRNLDTRVNVRGIGLVIVYGELHHLFFAPSLFKSTLWLKMHGRESSAFLP